MEVVVLIHSLYSGVTHQVVVSVDVSGGITSQRKVGETECERLFGIIPAKFVKSISADTPSYKVRLYHYTTTFT